MEPNYRQKYKQQSFILRKGSGKGRRGSYQQVNYGAELLVNKKQVVWNHYN